jgi:hypothetical protein
MKILRFGWGSRSIGGVCGDRDKDRAIRGEIAREILNLLYSREVSWYQFTLLVLHVTHTRILNAAPLDLSKPLRLSCY